MSESVDFTLTMQLFKKLICFKYFPTDRKPKALWVAYSDNQIYRKLETDN